MTLASANPALIRLVDHLKAGGMTNRDARRALESGKVFLGDAPTADATRMVDPSKVSIRPDAQRCRVGKDVAFIYRDPHLAVVIKPAGMLSVSAPKRRGEETLIGKARRTLKEAFVVHRIDQQTSGLMMVARTEPCQLALKKLLEDHRIDRSYLALVNGPFPTGEKTVRNTLVRDRGDGRRGSGDARDGKNAVTHLSLVGRLGRTASLVAARLETGRTHQVRIHLAELGFPVLGDPLYGPRKLPSPRLALHSHRLRFKHPMTGEGLTFEAPLADDLEKTRRELAEGPRRGRRR